jgi:hypothetical protein
MVPLQYTNFGVFLVSFSIGAYTHNWLAGLGFVLVILHTVFWESDFVSITNDINVWFNIWTSGIALAAGIAGHIYAKAMDCPQLILLSTVGSLREKVYIPFEDILVFLFATSVICLAAGINFWLARTEFGGGGLSPINANLVNPGIWMTIAFTLIILLTTVAFLATHIDGRVTLKYLWLILLPPLSLVLNDLAYFNWNWSSPWPGLLSLFAMILLWLFVFWLAYAAPIVRQHVVDIDETKSALVKSSDFDPMYNNKEYAVAFFGGIGLICVVGSLGLNLICSWFTNFSLETGAIVMISYSGIVIIGSVIMNYAGSKTIAGLRKFKLVEVDAVKGAFPVRPDIMGRTADGRYVPLTSERGIRLTDIMPKNTGRSVRV